MTREGLAEAATKAGTRLVACLYGRVSNDPARDRTSVVEQDAANKRDCSTRNWAVGGSYADNDMSASRFAKTERPGWDQLLEDLADAQYQVLVLWEASRGDRRLEEWIRLLNLCRDLGVWIHITSHGHTYDVRKRRDYKTLAEEGVDSSDESEKVSGRVQRSVDSRAERGTPHGRLLWGYRRIYEVSANGKRTIVAQVADDALRPSQHLITLAALGALHASILAGHPSRALARAASRGLPIPNDAWFGPYGRAQTVLEMAKRFASGEGANGLAIDLNRRGIPTPHLGKKGWTDVQVTHQIENPGVAGKRVLRGEVVGDASWEPIVPVKIWRAVVAKLADPSRRTQHDTAVKHLVSGIATCGVCGGVVRQAKRRGGEYQCFPKAAVKGMAFHVARKQDGVDAYVQMSVWERLARPDIAELLAEDVRADRRAAELADQVQEMTSRLNEARDAYSRGNLPMEALTRIEASLAPEIERAREKMDHVRLGPVLEGLVSPDVATVEAAWWERTLPQRREVLRVLTVRIEILKLGAGRRNYSPEESVNIVWRKPAR
ncbi:MAG: hypothetical protein JWN52_6630 [Actinomycetia bacterium]|nr:hypothetical protein [Actinomycetes bacterium]